MQRAAAQTIEKLDVTAGCHQKLLLLPLPVALAACQCFHAEPLKSSKQEVTLQMPLQLAMALMTAKSLVSVAVLVWRAGLKRITRFTLLYR